MAETKPTYNGWKNRETWNVMLHLDNEYDCYKLYTERVRQYKAKNVRISGMRARMIATQAIGPKTFDGISLGSRKIDWTEIATAMVAE